MFNLRKHQQTFLFIFRDLETFQPNSFATIKTLGGSSERAGEGGVERGVGGGDGVGVESGVEVGGGVGVKSETTLDEEAS